ncbi:hypothetical protein HDU83_004454 [Entophlyctis luteolus]|nr:hypothetical protein HDU83_004454 [Entophlyctis luteolus]
MANSVRGFDYDYSNAAARTSSPAASRNISAHPATSSAPVSLAYPDPSLPPPPMQQPPLYALRAASTMSHRWEPPQTPQTAAPSQLRFDYYSSYPVASPNPAPTVSMPHKNIISSARFTGPYRSSTPSGLSSMQLYSDVRPPSTARYPPSQDTHYAYGGYESDAARSESVSRTTLSYAQQRQSLPPPPTIPGSVPSQTSSLAPSSSRPSTVVGSSRSSVHGLSRYPPPSGAWPPSMRPDSAVGYASSGRAGDSEYGSFRRKDSSAIDYASEYGGSNASGGSRRYVDRYAQGRQVVFGQDRDIIELDPSATPRTAYSRYNVDPHWQNIPQQMAPDPYSNFTRKAKPTLSPHYPAPGSGAGTPIQVSGDLVNGGTMLSPRIRAMSVESANNVSVNGDQHSHLPPSLGSNSRYIQSLLGKSNVKGVKSERGTVREIDQKSQKTPVASTKAFENNQRPSTAPEKTPVAKPSVFSPAGVDAAEQTISPSDDGSVDAGQSVPSSSLSTLGAPKKSSLRRVKNATFSSDVSSSASATTTLASDSSAADAGSVRKSGIENLAEEINGIKNEVGLLEKRFGSGAKNAPSNGIYQELSSDEKEGHGDRAAFETTIVFISRNIRQCLRTALTIKETLSAGEGTEREQTKLSGLVDSNITQLRTVDRMVELLRLDEHISLALMVSKSLYVHAAHLALVALLVAYLAFAILSHGGKKELPPPKAALDDLSKSFAQAAARVKAHANASMHAVFDSAEPLGKPRNLVVCMDGTWQFPGNALDAVSQGGVKTSTGMAPSNVVKLAYLLQESGKNQHDLDQDALEQVVYYHSGPGTEVSDQKDHNLEGAFGNIHEHLLDAYTWLCRNYRNGDELYAFGFSRGATIVRSLFSFIRHVGLARGTSPEDLKKHIAEAFSLYERRLAKDLPSYNRKLAAFQAEHVHKNVTMKLIGVFDTVAALTVPKGYSKVVSSNLLEDVLEDVGVIEENAYHDLDIGKEVQYAYHAIAIDENREFFPPKLFETVDFQELEESGKVREQKWFRGSHGDIGGGWWEHGLTDVTLHWMIEKSRAAGLKIRDIKHFDRAFLPFLLGIDKNYYLRKKEKIVHDFFDKYPNGVSPLGKKTPRPLKQYMSDSTVLKSTVDYSVVQVSDKYPLPVPYNELSQ